MAYGKKESIFEKLDFYSVLAGASVTKDADYKNGKFSVYPIKSLASGGSVELMRALNENRNDSAVFNIAELLFFIGREREGVAALINFAHVLHNTKLFTPDKKSFVANSKTGIMTDRIIAAAYFMASLHTRSKELKIKDKYGEEELRFGIEKHTRLLLAETEKYIEAMEVGRKWYKQSLNEALSNKYDVKSLSFMTYKPEKIQDVAEFTKIIDDYFEKNKILLSLAYETIKIKTTEEELRIGENLTVGSPLKQENGSLYTMFSKRLNVKDNFEEDIKKDYGGEYSIKNYLDSIEDGTEIFIRAKELI